MGGRPGKEGRGVLLAGEGVGRRGGELADGERGGGVWGGGGLAPRPQRAGRALRRNVGSAAPQLSFFLSARVFAAGSFSPKQRLPLRFQHSVPFHFTSAAFEGRGLFPEACFLCCFRKLIFH